MADDKGDCISWQTTKTNNCQAKTSMTDHWWLWAYVQWLDEPTNRAMDIATGQTDNLANKQTDNRQTENWQQTTLSTLMTLLITY